MEPTVTVATILGYVTTFVTSAISWVGSWVSTIADNPILIIACVAMPLAGFGIGAIRRLMRLRA